jgi:predicted glycoside hydrolase/deacetylase ChbG (UPF0249 family)
VSTCPYLLKEIFVNKYCIVNGDDFGASHGINRGILEAHQKGILTSTSLMVNMPGAEEAARLSREAPLMSIGLHITLTSEKGAPLIDFDSFDICKAELDRQWDRFVDLLEGPPTHLDAHHNIHRDERLKPLFMEMAERQNVFLREHSQVRYFSEFYGQWDGEMHLEQISVKNLCSMLQTEITEGFTELSCHPGYVDPDYLTSYSLERETELKTICSPQVRQTLNDLGIKLISYQELLAPVR